jgi:hypothetical protein
MAFAQAFVFLLSIYGGLGAVFAIGFVTAGAGRVDSSARGAGLGFRLLIFPGTAALWPLLLRLWIRESRRSA